MARSSERPLPPVRIDGFDQFEPIGRGGFSDVYSARQRDFNRRVAVKVLGFGLEDERERRNFERECRAMGLVSQHPHIVTVFNSAFTAAKQPCIVMELYSGGTMADRRRREGSLTVATVLDVGVKIAGALQTAHDRGLLHRDIKPQNLFISEFGEPALGDFGISTLDDERSISSGGGLTVHYAPPEVLEGAPASPLSDVYSLAATLYTLLEGTRPFSAGGGRQSVGELARRIMLEEAPRAKRADVPRSLAELLARTMAKDPAARPLSAAAFGRELQRVQGELGLPVTALPLAGPEPDPTRLVPGPSPDAGPTPVTIPPRPPADAPGPVPPPDPDPSIRVRGLDESDQDEGRTVTVARRSPPAAAPDDREGGGGPSTRRIVLGTAAAVISLLAVAAALVVFGGALGDETDDTVAPTRSAAPDIVPIGPPTPVGLTAAPAADALTVTVAWEPPADPSRIAKYQVVRQDTGEVVETDDGTTYSVVFPTPDGVVSRACFTVEAIDGDGSFSGESRPVCT